ncbi:hypothetical protein D5S17_07085 [Pseudonocardiaceae bacterium YIM PH 21723]|nr:hypothetical protein D5S17_07085 [Pseudonocardiaceae bacterium YIM PH 21723]
MVGLAPAALAAPDAIDGTATAATAKVNKAGTISDSGPQAKCVVDETSTAHSNGAAVSGVYRLGASDTSCTRAQNRDVTVTADETRFQLDAVPDHLVRIAKLHGECKSTPQNVSFSSSFEGIQGLDLPPKIDPGYTAEIKGKNGATAAKFVFSEITKNNNGELNINQLHVTTYAAGGASADSDIVLGNIGCSTTF